MRNGYQNYFDDEVLTASPLKLVQLLYEGALDAVATARRALVSGDIASRSRAINKAMAIVTELSLSLNHAQGGEFSRNLGDLYGYVETRLIQANVEQSETPLAEVEGLLTILLGAWRSCADPGRTSAGPAKASEKYVPISCAC